ncbi:MAG: hypothetical protein WCE64_16200 [Bacteroidales bacterium]
MTKFKIAAFCVIVTLAEFSLTPQEKVKPTAKNWSYGTAVLLRAGQWETGIFQQFRFGLNDNLEIHSSLLLLPLIPNAGIKVSLGTMKGFTFASDHVLSYPTVFLNLVSRKGIGGLIPPEFDFPFVLSFGNSILVSRAAGKKTLVTAYAGIYFSIRTGKPDPQSTFDLPLVYPRMSHYYSGPAFRYGLSCRGAIVKRFCFDQGIQFFSITGNRNNFFAENTGSVLWSSNRLGIKAGYILSYGKYPFGTHWQMWPSIDLIFGSKKN